MRETAGDAIARHRQIEVAMGLDGYGMRRCQSVTVTCGGGEEVADGGGEGQGGEWCWQLQS